MVHRTPPPYDLFAENTPVKRTLDLISSPNYELPMDLFSYFVVILYFISTGLQGFYLKNPLASGKLAAIFIGWSAIMAHGVWLVLNLYQTTRVSLLMLVSLACWFMNVLTQLNPLEKRSIQSFALVTFPVTAISLLLSGCTSPTIAIADTQQLFHLILATLTFTTLTLSGIWAMILAVQDRKLRQQHRCFPSLFPSIESMEKFLFRLLTTGFLLLTTLIISSLLLYIPVEFQDANLGILKFNGYAHKMDQPLINKVMLSFCVWFVLAILLGGRFYSGWRGLTVLRWTFLGTSLLITLYFGSLLG